MKGKKKIIKWSVIIAIVGFLAYQTVVFTTTYLKCNNGMFCMPSNFFGKTYCKHCVVQNILDVFGIKGNGLSSTQ
jgi:hypothetical protein